MDEQSGRSSASDLQYANAEPIHAMQVASDARSLDRLAPRFASAIANARRLGSSRGGSALAQTSFNGYGECAVMPACRRTDGFR
jgi:hypothetical protein